VRMHQITPRTPTGPKSRAPTDPDLVAPIAVMILPNGCIPTLSSAPLIMSIGVAKSRENETVSRLRGVAAVAPQLIEDSLEMESKQNEFSSQDDSDSEDSDSFDSQPRIYSFVNTNVIIATLNLVSIHLLILTLLLRFLQIRIMLALSSHIWYMFFLSQQ
jgi:hypothetical protein